MVERTLSIIKPDAVRSKKTGKIITMYEEHGFSILGQKKLLLQKEDARVFYVEHKDSPFFEELVEFMVSGPIVIQVLEKESAIKSNRELMGATDPKEAKEGTIRKLYANSKGENAVHGSDSLSSAAREISYFFSESELLKAE